MDSFVSQFGLPLGSGLMAAAVSFASATILYVVTYPKSKLPGSDAFEQQRLEKLRVGSTVFRWFELLVVELKRFSGENSEKHRQLDRRLKLTKENLPWTAAEFVAVKRLESVLSAAAVFLLIAPTGFVGVATLLALVLLFSYPWLAENSIASRSERHLKSIRLRMPFAVDQIALMMQAGAEFEDSLQTVVRDNADHPLSVELGEVLRQVSLGRPRSQALSDLRHRLDDKDISELVFAINKGEELGTPMSSILREQADQMRLKRSQWGEKAASEAEVQMVFPGMIVMVACLLVIVAPILLPALMTFLE